MQAIGKCLPTYQLMELIKTFLNKGQVNGFASLYLALFTPVSYTHLDVYKRQPLKATKGRASYVGERSIDHIDPGSYSSGLLFEAYLEVEE